MKDEFLHTDVVSNISGKTLDFESHKSCGLEGGPLTIYTRNSPTRHVVKVTNKILLFGGETSQHYRIDFFKVV